jgi:Domain of unknown function (DUF5671)
MTTTTTSVDDLDGFIRTAKDRDVPDAALVPLLRQNGWSERRIYDRLTAFYATALGVAPPRRSARGEYAGDAFLYLLNFITLGFWSVALGQIFVTLISHAFPDAANPYYRTFALNQIAWQLATIIIAFPCFLIIARLIGRELQRRTDAVDSGVRAWLTYIALVIAGLVTLGDGIWVVATFLNGELTARFILDSLVVIGLSSGIFAYYLKTLRPASTEG